MEHVVFFPTPDGTPAFRRLSSLEEAVRLVEHLRNVEGVASVSVHALTEVPLSFRAYYRVEVPVAAEPAAQVVLAPVQETPVLAPEPVPALVLVDELPVEAAVEPAAEGVVEVPAQAEPVLENEPEPEAVPEPEPAYAPAMAASNGHAAPASLGFFA